MFKDLNGLCTKIADTIVQNSNALTELVIVTRNFINTGSMVVKENKIDSLNDLIINQDDFKKEIKGKYEVHWLAIISNNYRNYLNGVNPDFADEKLMKFLDNNMKAFEKTLIAKHKETSKQKKFTASQLKAYKLSSDYLDAMVGQFMGYVNGLLGPRKNIDCKETKAFMLFMSNRCTSQIHKWNKDYFGAIGSLLKNEQKEMSNEKSEPKSSNVKSYDEWISAYITEGQRRVRRYHEVLGQIDKGTADKLNLAFKNLTK